MKKLIYLSMVIFTLSLMSFSACEKSDDVVTPAKPEYSIVGDWKFESVSYNENGILLNDLQLKNKGYDYYKFSFNFDENNVTVIADDNTTYNYPYSKTANIIDINPNKLVYKFEIKSLNETKLELILLEEHTGSSKPAIGAIYTLNK